MKKSNIIIIILSCFLFLLAFLVKSESIINIDDNLLRLISTLRTEELTYFFRIYTDIILILVLIITLILLFSRFNNRIKIALLFNSIGIGVLNITIKSIFKISRPVTFMLINQLGYSFPSGHTLVATSYYLLISYIIYKNVNKKCLKYSIISFLILIILSVGFSRMYLGVHYCSDVLASILLGTIILLIEIKIIKEWKYGKSIRSKKG